MNYGDFLGSLIHPRKKFKSIYIHNTSSLMFHVVKFGESLSADTPNCGNIIL